MAKMYDTSLSASLTLNNVFCSVLKPSLMTYCIVYSPLGHFEWKSATGGNDSDEGHLNNVILRRW